jgi:hypothetical protein
MSTCSDRTARKTIALTNLENGWVFRLHSDNRRVWLDSFPSNAPVPLSFLAGDRVGELEVVIGSSIGVGDMITAARRLLPAGVAVSEISEIEC